MKKTTTLVMLLISIFSRISDLESSALIRRKSVLVEGKKVAYLKSISTESVQKILDGGHGINEYLDEAQNRLLHLACSDREDPYELASFLLQNNADVDSINLDGATPLHCASDSGNSSCVQVLLASKADVNKRRTRGNVTALHLACLEGERAVVNQLLCRDDLEIDSPVDVDGMHTPLHLASLLGSPAIIRCLAQKGASLNAQTSSKQTPLHVASQLGKNACVEVLLKQGADVNAVMDFNITALYLAVQNEYPSVVKTLLACKQIKPDIKEKTQGATPLHLACYTDSLPLVKLLVAAGADKDVQDVAGATPLAVACRYGNYPIVHLLFSNGARADIPLHNETTALYVAASEGHGEIVSFLLEYGIDVNAQVSNATYTPLHGACANGKTDIVRLLLSHPATQVNITATLNRTPLHVAIEEGHAEIVAQLLAHGALVKMKTRSQETALSLAEKLKVGGNGDRIVLMLRKALVENRKCATCKQSDKTLKCAGCELIYYCDHKCQKKHWKVHKTLCNKYSTGRSNNS